MKSFKTLNISLIQTFTSLLLLTVTSGYSQSNFESYFLKNKNYPSYDNLWTPDGLGDAEVEGVAHDDNNWFFTWTYNKVGYLYKVPVDIPLDNNAFTNSRTIGIRGKGYWHWGDPDYYYSKETKTGFIVVPCTAENGPPIVTIYRAKDLSIVAYGKLNNQKSTGWCAVHPITGELFTSKDFGYTKGTKGEKPCKPNGNCNDQSYHCLYPRTLLRYKIPWESLPKTGYEGEITLTYQDSDVELTGSGGESLELYNMQGGEFSESGNIFFISAGGGCCKAAWLGGGDGQQYYFDGVYAFDTRNNTTSWKSIKRSYNHDEDFPLKRLSKYFDYHYPLGCDGAGSWSPEGLTIWDLDDGRAPGITGQLHVLVFKFHATGENREVFEHFSNRVYVDHSLGKDQILFPGIDDGISDDDPLRGSKASPFKTFNYAYNGYPVWSGAEIVLKAGSYSAVGKYSKRIRILSQGGAALIK